MASSTKSDIEFPLLSRKSEVDLANFEAQLKKFRLLQIKFEKNYY